jgi:hypothetical protein
MSRLGLWLMSEALSDHAAEDMRILDLLRSNSNSISDYPLRGSEETFRFSLPTLDQPLGTTSRRVLNTKLSPIDPKILFVPTLRATARPHPHGRRRFASSGLPRQGSMMRESTANLIPAPQTSLKLLPSLAHEGSRVRTVRHVGQGAALGDNRVRGKPPRS